MTRLLEFIVACILVLVLAVVVGVLMPSHGHVQRSIEISHNMGHVYDMVNNFRRFSDYSAMLSLDQNIKLDVTGPSYGVGGKVAWQSATNVGNGNLEITSSEKDKQVVWALQNDWRGKNKHYTIDLARNDSGKLVKVTMSYDVDYGWNLIDRYSQLYLHGHPATFMQYTLTGLQTTLANIPNIGYKDLQPVLVDTPQKPVLVVSTKAKRTLDDIAVATNKALEQINDAIADLGVAQTGPYITLTTNWGTDTYSFDVAVPIDTAKLKIGDRVVDLHDAPQAKSLAEQNLENAMEAEADETAAAEGASEGEQGEVPTEGPGSFDDDGSLLVNDVVRAKLAFGGRALMAALHGGPAPLALMRLGLKAYAGTHGYAFNEYAERLYDIDISDPSVEAVDDREFRIYLPVSTSPAQTPWQEANADFAQYIIDGGNTSTEALEAREAASQGAPAQDAAPQPAAEGQNG